VTTVKVRCVSIMSVSPHLGRKRFKKDIVIEIALSLLSHVFHSRTLKSLKVYYVIIVIGGSTGNEPTPHSMM
jgi:20S proteasome alpha/beta subunit